MYSSYVQNSVQSRDAALWLLPVCSSQLYHSTVNTLRARTMFYICMWHLVLNTGHVVHKHLSTESACYQKAILQTKEKGRTRAEQIRILVRGRGACSSFFAKIFENNIETVTLK